MEIEAIVDGLDDVRLPYLPYFEQSLGSNALFLVFKLLQAEQMLMKIDIDAILMGGMLCDIIKNRILDSELHK